MDRSMKEGDFFFVFFPTFCSLHRPRSLFSLKNSDILLYDLEKGKTFRNLKINPTYETGYAGMLCYNVAFPIF